MIVAVLGGLSLGFGMQESVLGDASRVYTADARFGVDPGRLITCIITLEVGASSTVPIGFDNSLYSNTSERDGDVFRELVVLQDVAFKVTFADDTVDVPVLSFWEMGATERGAYVAGFNLNMGTPLHIHSATKSRNVFSGACTIDDGCRFPVGAIVLRFKPTMVHQECSDNDMISAVTAAHQQFSLCAHRTAEPGVYDFTSGEQQHAPLFSLWQNGNSTAELQLLTPVHNAVEEAVLSVLLLIVLLFFIRQTRLLSLVAARQCTSAAKKQPWASPRFDSKMRALAVVPPDLLASAGISVAYAAGASGRLNVPSQIEEVHGEYFRMVWGTQLASLFFGAAAAFLALRDRKKAQSPARKTALYVLARLAVEANLMIAAYSHFPDEIGPDFKIMIGFFTGIIVVVAASRDLVFMLSIDGRTGAYVAAALIQYGLAVHTVLFALVFPAMYITPAITNYKLTSSTLSAMLVMQSMFVGGIIAGRHIRNARTAWKTPNAKPALQNRARF